MQIKFFEEPTLLVAEKLLNCFLCRRLDDKVLRLPILEVEAYLGKEDLASHARFGKTKRNFAMFEQPGTWYVYLCYGMHWMLNLVTERKGTPSAILFRGVGNCNGPGKITKNLLIDSSLNGKFCDKSTGLWLELNNSMAKKNILRNPRVGVGYAGEGWAQKKYNFSCNC